MAEGREPYFRLPRTMPIQLVRLEVIDLTSFGSMPSSSGRVDGIRRAVTSSSGSSLLIGIEWNVADLGSCAIANPPSDVVVVRTRRAYWE